MFFAGERRSERTSTMRIVFYLFGSIAGFRTSLRRLRLSGRETIIRWHRAGFLMAFLVFIVEAKTVIIKKGDHDRDIHHDRRSVVID